MVGITVVWMRTGCCSLTTSFVGPHSIELYIFRTFRVANPFEITILVPLVQILALVTAVERKCSYGLVHKTEQVVSPFNLSPIEVLLQLRMAVTHYKVTSKLN